MSRTTIILAIVAILILAAAAYLLFGKSDPASAIVPGGSPVTSVELTFVALTARIEPVTFDSSIIDDPRFKALQDIRTVIISEPSGRIDPFAPLGR